MDVSLTSNQILEIDENAFVGLENLKRLSLRKNSMTEFHPDVFKHLNKLEVLALEGNSIYTIDDKLLRNLTSLTKLELKLNKIFKLRRRLQVPDQLEVAGHGGEPAPDDSNAALSEHNRIGDFEFIEE